MTHNPNKTPLSTERPDTSALRERSGSVTIDSHLVSFLYELMRDHVPPGIVEEVMRKTMGPSEVVYTNGWLARYAEDVASRLQAPTLSVIPVAPPSTAAPASTMQPRVPMEDRYSSVSPRTKREAR